MVRSGIAPLLVLVAALGGTSDLAAQGSATDLAAPGGAPGSMTAFWSPMVLEVPADPIRAMRGGLSWHVADFAGYSCEGASIPAIEVETHGDPEMHLKVDYDVDVILDASRGRKATLLLELVVDGRVVGAVERTRFHLSPGKPKRLVLKMDLTPVDSTIFSMGSVPQLRATLSMLN